MHGNAKVCLLEKVGSLSACMEELAFPLACSVLQGGGDVDAQEEGAAGKKGSKRELEDEDKEQQQQQQPSGKKSRRSRGTSGKSKMATLE
eukprot:1161217-Pelagomonas_calceolata.AAC.5